MPTIEPNFSLLAPLVTEIWRGYQNKKVGAANLPRRPLADNFLHGAIVPAYAYQHTKFQLPSSIAADHPKSWQNYLGFIIWSLREVPNETTGVPP